MKKISIITVLLCLSAGVLSAQGTGSLSSLYEKMTSSATSMDYSYSLLPSSGMKMTGDGSVTVQGNAYVMDANGLEMYCDGRTVWVVDLEGKEILMETPAEGENAYLDNPALLFVNMDEVFRIDGFRENGNAVTYLLSSKVESGVRTASITLDGSRNDPVITSATFYLSDDSRLDIKIKSMTFSQKKPLTSFFYDISNLDSSWLITDLR